MVLIYLRGNMRQFIVVIGGLLLALSSQAQELWLETGADAQFHKRMKAVVEQQLRFRDHLEEWRVNMTQVRLDYEVNSWMNIAGNYRYSIVHRKDNEHRLMGDLKLKHDLGESDWRVAYRLRYQFEWEADGEDHLYSLRNKLKFSKKLNKMVKTSFAGELFHVFSPELIPNRYRFTMGVETPLLDIFDFETFVRYQSEIEEAETIFGDEPDEATIIGISIHYKIPLAKHN